MSTKAFILGAGHGKRLQPYTNDLPKPLIEVGGRPLIDYTLDHLVKNQISEVVINTYYKAEKLEEHLKTRAKPKIYVSRETELLDTGGGIYKGLRHFNNRPFFVLSGDGFWEDGPGKTALQRLGQAWDPKKMDILMLLQPVESMLLTKGVGDYDLQPDGRAIRSKEQKGAYMFTSIRVNSPAIFRGAETDKPFSYLELMDRAEAHGRLFGLVHNGIWHHISTPDDLEAVRASM